MRVMFAGIFLNDAGQLDEPSLAIFAYSFSPLVEETSPDTVVIDAEGCELLFGSPYGLANAISERAKGPKEAGGLDGKVNVAIAANPDSAIHAARFYQGITFITPGEEITGLGDLPLENLTYSVSSLRSSMTEKHKSANRETLDRGVNEQEVLEILETLRLWGVQTFRDLSALPVTGVAERLGQLGVKLQQLAGGKIDRHLRLKQPPPLFYYSLELEHSIVQLEPLSFIFARLLNQMCASLHAYALATNELRLRLTLEKQEIHERVFNLPHPLRDNKVFLKLLLLDTEMHPPVSAVIAVSISCEPVKPRVLQNGLFIPLAPEPQKLELTLARLSKLLGPENVGSPELNNTHRPDAFRMKRFALQIKPTNRKRRSNEQDKPPFCGQPFVGFRVFRPPLKAMVEASNGYPTQISAWSKKMSLHGKIVQVAGPWRSTGDWWRLDRWARDEWDVAVANGSSSSVQSTERPALYRIYRELRNGSWFVHGSYD
jgi:protein ImuB